MSDGLQESVIYKTFPASTIAMNPHIRTVVIAFYMMAVCVGVPAIGGMLLYLIYHIRGGFGPRVESSSPTKNPDAILLLLSVLATIIGGIARMLGGISAIGRPGDRHRLGGRTWRVGDTLFHRKRTRSSEAMGTHRGDHCNGGVADHQHRFAADLATAKVVLEADDGGIQHLLALGYLARIHWVILHKIVLPDDPLRWAWMFFRLSR